MLPVAALPRTYQEESQLKEKQNCEMEKDSLDDII